MEQKRLYLSDDKKIGGVCGGIAEYFNIDPTIVRLLWILLTLANGVGILLYLIALFVIPESPYSGEPKPEVIIERVRDTFSGHHGQNSAARSFGIVLIIIGAAILLAKFIPFISWTVFVSLALIGVGLFLILQRR